MLTAEELAKYFAVTGTTIKAEQLIKQLCNTQIEVCRALIKSQEYQIKHYNQFHLNVNFNVKQLI